MLSESELIYERQKLYSLMHDHPEWSLRAYARSLQHDLKWVRKWAKRLTGLVRPTLDMFRSQSRKPKRSAKQLPEKLKDTICIMSVKTTPDCRCWLNSMPTVRAWWSSGRVTCSKSSP